MEASSSSVKMTVAYCLGTINMCLFWISLTVVTLSADCYCGTLSLRRPFFPKVLSYFTKVLSFHMKMTGVIHKTGQLFMDVHLIGYGSVPILRWLFYLSLNLEKHRLATDSTRCWCEASYHLLATDTLQQSLPWNISLGTTEGQMLRWSWWLRWGVYRLLHMCHVLIKVTITFWHKCLLPYFVEVLCIYIAVYTGEFVNTGCSEWWGFCVICW